MKAILLSYKKPANDSLRNRLFDTWETTITEAGDTWENARQIPSQFGDVAISWGIRDTEAATRKAALHLVMEQGFIGDRAGEYFYLGYGGLNGNGAPLIYPSDKRKRGEELYHLLKPAKHVNRRDWMDLVCTYQWKLSELHTAWNAIKCHG